MGEVRTIHHLKRVGVEGVRLKIKIQNLISMATTTCFLQLHKQIARFSVNVVQIF